MNKNINNKILKHTVNPTGQDGDEPQHIVCVLAGGDIAKGFAATKSLLDQHKAVRLIGPGVTINSAIPKWAKKLIE